MKFKLGTAHYFPGDIYLEEGECVGDDTSYPIPKGWLPPSSAIPLDDEAKALYKKTGSGKPNWGYAPEETLRIHGEPLPISRPAVTSNSPESQAAARDIEMARKANEAAAKPGQGPLTKLIPNPGQGNPGVK